MSKLFSFSLIMLVILCPFKSLDAQEITVEGKKIDSAFVLKMIEDIGPFFDNYQTDSVIHYSRKIIDYSHQIDFPRGVGSGHRDICIMYWVEGKLDSATYHNDLAIKHFLQGNDSTGAMNQIFVKGRILRDYGKIEEALDKFMVVLPFYKKTESPHLGRLWNSFGGVFDLMKDTVKSREAYLEAIAWNKDQGDYRAMLAPLSNLGVLYTQEGHIDRALAIFEEVLDWDKKLGLEFESSSHAQNIGDLYYKKGDFQTALAYHEEALAVRRKYKQKRPIIFSLVSMGKNYLAMNQASKALPFVNEARDLAVEMKASTLHQMCLEWVARTHAALKNYSQAYTFQTRARTLKDSLFNIENNEKINDLIEKYENEKKEAEIERLSVENQLKDATITNERQIQYGMGAGILGLLLLGGLIWNGQRRKLHSERVLAAKNEEIRESAFQKTLTELELKALRAQMNPHFIFNCMNSINRLILEDKNDQASRTLSKFSKLVRQILEHSERKTISLKEELDMLETYIQLEVQRFKNKIQYEIKVDPDLDSEDIELPSMVLQPFIENAIWHGLMHKEEGEGKISIQIEEKDGMLHCIIEDNGVGREKALELKNKNNTTHKSMAMKVTRDRLSLLAKEGFDKLVRIVDLKDVNNNALGTQVLINIPVS
ncbi:MAG: histidine kinase [Bacteroidota bacterium]